MSLKKRVYPFSTEAPTKEQQINMDLLSVLEQTGPIDPERLREITGATGDDIEKFVSAGFKSNILQYTGDQELEFRSAPLKMLGISISGDECSLKVTNAKGLVLKEERIKVLSMDKYKGTKTDTNKIVRSIRTGTKLHKEEMSACGLAIPYSSGKWTPDVIDLFAFSMQKIFKCPVFLASEELACGYAQRNAEGLELGRTVLYVHSDTGSAVIFKKGLIYESAVDATGMRSYLRQWRQFGLVATAKELIDRGLGTDMIAMVSGDLSKLEIKTVFQAARAGDELAMDLVKRSALALGVRIAYLVNIFDVDNVLLSKKLSTDGAVFIRYVKESSRRLLLDRKKDAVEIIPGVLEASCISDGAASLCRRQLILEV